MKKQVVPFIGTKEQEEQLCNVIAGLKNQNGSLLPIMQQAQVIYGYLPIEVQKIIADNMNIPMEEVYGAASYYSGFQMTPKGKYQLTVCLGTACHMNGADKVSEAIADILGIGEGECTPDRMFSIENRHCVGACAVGPVLMINDTIHGKMTPQKAALLIAECKAEAVEKVEEV